MDNKESSRSWFCVLNNPQEIYSGEPHEIAEKCLEDWVNVSPTRAGAVAYCVSSNGLIHLHMVLEDSNKARFSTLKKTYPKANLQPTKGSKEQAESYINKRGKFAEKGEQIIYIAKHGEIKGNQGARKDLEYIDDLIQEGKTPNQIMEMSLSYRRYDKIIKDAYYHKRSKETPMKRDITVYWHIGGTGSGKSHTVTELVKERSEDDVYIVSDYKNGFDKYNGEKVLFLDEYRGQLPYALFLTILDGYKVQIPCRYTNILSLWIEIHITSVLPPEVTYKNMVNEGRDLDTVEQLKRRINFIVHHYIKDGEYCKHEIPMEEYTGYEALMKRSTQ